MAMTLVSGYARLRFNNPKYEDAEDANEHTLTMKIPGTIAMLKEEHEENIKAVYSMMKPCIDPVVQGLEYVAVKSVVKEGGAA